jgi:hypothetical protein
MKAGICRDQLMAELLDTAGKPEFSTGAGGVRELVGPASGRAA